MTKIESDEPEWFGRGWVRGTIEGPGIEVIGCWRGRLLLLYVSAGNSASSRHFLSDMMDA